MRAGFTGRLPDQRDGDITLFAYSYLRRVGSGGRAGQGRLYALLPLLVLIGSLVAEAGAQSIERTIT